MKNLNKEYKKIFIGHIVNIVSAAIFIYINFINIYVNNYETVYKLTAVPTLLAELIGIAATLIIIIGVFNIEDYNKQTKLGFIFYIINFVLLGASNVISGWFPSAVDYVDAVGKLFLILANAFLIKGIGYKEELDHKFIKIVFFISTILLSISLCFDIFCLINVITSETFAILSSFYSIIISVFIMLLLNKTIK